MNKLNVGDYVRTKDGIIGKIESKNFIGYNDWIIDTLYYNDDEIIDDWTCGIKEYDIIKSSTNIIDLIQVGDYVNGDCVIEEVPKDKRKKQVIIVNSTCVEYGELEYENKEIETVITHEQIKQMEYKVGE